MKAMTTAAALGLSMMMAGCGEREPRNTDWPLLGNGSQMQHHAGLAQIDRESVGKLGLAWAVDMPTTYDPHAVEGRWYRATHQAT